MPTGTISNMNDDKTAETAWDVNFIWIILRQSNMENKEIQSWTGFNINIRNDIATKEDILCYLLTINAPATELQLPVIIAVVD